MPPDESCEDCPAGTSSTPGATTCQACDKGKFNNINGGTCRNCLKETFQDQNTKSSTSCMDCPSGWSSDAGSAKCVAPAITCGTGTTLEGTVCKASATTSPSPAGTKTTTSRCTTTGTGPTTLVKYAVTHTIALKGLTAAQFNQDPLIVQSFRDSVAAVLRVPAADIINIAAIKEPTRQRRQLGASSCKVSYDVKVNSKSAMKSMSTKMKATFTDSSVFTEKMQENMVTNNVSSITAKSITSDTSAAPEDAGTMTNDATNDATNNDSQQQQDTMILYVVVGVLVLLVGVLLGYLCFGRRRTEPTIAKKSPSIELFRHRASENKMNTLKLNVNMNMVVEAAPPTREVFTDPSSGSQYFINPSGVAVWVDEEDVHGLDNPMH
jgi:predicted nucleic acid-binding Zn ribbon protein